LYSSASRSLEDRSAGRQGQHQPVQDILPVRDVGQRQPGVDEVHVAREIVRRQVVAEDDEQRVGQLQAWLPVHREHEAVTARPVQQPLREAAAAGPDFHHPLVGQVEPESFDLGGGDGVEQLGQGGVVRGRVGKRMRH
jgi:hypothetical protein